MEEELKEKRELLLEKNQQLDTLNSQMDDEMQVVSLEQQESDSEGEKPGSCDPEGISPADLTDDIMPGEQDPEGISPADLIDDIMLLNEEVEVLDAHVTETRKQLQNLGEIVKCAQFEDIGERDEYQAAAELALELATRFEQLKEMEFKLHELVKSMEELRQQHHSFTGELPSN